MEVYYIIIIMLLLITNSINEMLSVKSNQNNGKIRPNFAEIFGQGWENENENYHQNNQIEFIDVDQNDQLDNQQKREIIHKFHAIKEGIKKKEKYSTKNRNKIEQKIAQKLGINRKKIYKWKKEIGFVYENKFYKQKKQEFVGRIDEIKRMSKKGTHKQFAKELGISEKTLIKWKKEFGIEIGKSGNRYSKKEKMRKMNDYYKMKNETPSLCDKEIAAHLKIGSVTLSKWKKIINS